MNFVEGSLRDTDGRACFVTGTVSLDVPRAKTMNAKAGETLTLGIRPEDLRIEPAGDRSFNGEGGGDVLAGRVLLVERLGGTSHVHFDLKESGTRMMAAVTDDRLPEIGEAITVRVPSGRVHLFAADGKAMSHQ